MEKLYSRNGCYLIYFGIYIDESKSRLITIEITPATDSNSAFDKLCRTLHVSDEYSCEVKIDIEDIDVFSICPEVLEILEKIKEIRPKNSNEIAAILDKYGFLEED